MTGPVEDEAVFQYRCARMREELDAVTADMVSTALADHCGDNSQLWVDRIYGRLEDLHPRDLALMVVLLMYEAATVEATRLWSGLHTMTPEDMR